MTVVTLASLPSLYFIAPASALAALAAAFWFSRKVMAYSEGEPLMIEIAQAVRDGAMAYLKRQYKVVAAVFVVLLAILILLGITGIQSLMTPVGVLFAPVARKHAPISRLPATRRSRGCRVVPLAMRKKQ